MRRVITSHNGTRLRAPCSGLSGNRVFSLDQRRNNLYTFEPWMGRSFRKNFRWVTFSGSDVTVISRCAACKNLGTGSYFVDCRLHVCRFQCREPCRPLEGRLVTANLTLRDAFKLSWWIPQTVRRSATAEVYVAWRA